MAGCSLGERYLAHHFRDLDVGCYVCSCTERLSHPISGTNYAV